jgi:hypothetical protein
MVQEVRCSIYLPLFAKDQGQEALPSTLAFLNLNTLLKTKKRRTKEPVLSTEEQQFDPDLGSRQEQAVDDRHRQIMSAQAPLKERIEEESGKGSGNEESGKGSGNEESAKAGNEENAKGSGKKKRAPTAPTKLSLLTEKGGKNLSATLMEVGVPMIKRAATPLLLTRMLKQ